MLNLLIGSRHQMYSYMLCLCSCSIHQMYISRCLSWPVALETRCTCYVHLVSRTSEEVKHINVHLVSRTSEQIMHIMTHLVSRTAEQTKSVMTHRCLEQLNKLNT
jgi:hypothetical protein